MVTNDNKDKLEENIIEEIEKLQKEFPNLVLPSMGLVQNKDDIAIDGKDYIECKDVREE